MNEQELLDKISAISIWKNGGQRAPHKPLLLLFALAKFQNEHTQSIQYAEVKDALTKLLIEFGPKRKIYHPQEPFVRLSNDGIWELNSEIHIDRKNPKNRLLLENDVSGGFNSDVISLLSKKKHLINTIAEMILNDHFPATIHEDILLSVGLDLNYQVKRRRNPYFREKILKAYEYSCAVCGFNVRLGHNLVAIEAAHIKWHQAGGPDIEKNGVALCSMHHKLFDRGVFTINEDNRFLVAEQAHGTNGFEEWLMRYHGKEMRSPIHPNYRPQENYLHWHVKEVFKGPYRCYG